MNILKTLGLGVAMTFSLGAFAQEQSTTAASNPSARPIPESDMMYRKTVWRTIDLREKQNKPLFADGRQITKIIIDAVKNSMDVLLSEEELEARRKTWIAPPLKATSGVLYKYAKTVSSASEGCVTDEF